MARIDDVRELAVKVMGCQATPIFEDYFEMKHPSRGFLCWHATSRNEYTWDPYENPRAALEVVEAMENRGYWMRAEKTKDGYYVRFNKIGDMSRWAAHMSTSFCESICTAALAAIREAQ